MRVKRVLAIAVIAASYGIGFGQAQTLADKQVPAEFPPASYTGRQYVDSNGCVFIRAGIDGNVSWVPRVSRSRKVLCGFQPTLAPARTAKAAPPTAKTVRKKPVAQAQSTPKPTAPKTVRDTGVQTAPARKVRVVKPAPTVAAPPKTVKTPARTVRVVPAETTRASACQGGSAVSNRYMGSGDVRCGPQAAPHVTYVQGGGGSGVNTRPVRVIRQSAATSATPVYTAPHYTSPRSYATVPRSAPMAQQPVRVVPRHVYEEQQKARGTYIPQGYKKVWDDDRLNPYRAHQTLEGKAQMEVAWSSTVPRYLINKTTGRDITYKYPGLRYPYTSFEEQRAAGVTISTRGQVVSDPVRVVRSERRVKAQPVKHKADPAQAVVSTRSAAAATVPQAASHRYVHIGAFADPVHARHAAERIATRGLPARLSKVTRDGATYTVIRTGPFRTQSDLQTALNRVRSAGFSGAVPRN